MSVALTAGGYQGPASVHTRGLGALGVALAGHGLALDVTPDVTATGRKAADLLGMVERGETDLCYFASSYLAGRVPALGVLDLPFPPADRAAAYAALDGALGAALRDAVAAATGYRVLGFWDNGFRHLSNRVRPLRAPADCAGLRLRTLDSAAHQAVFRALGFDPVVIDVKDLAAAVADGTVDAQENPLTNTVNFGLHRTHRFVSLTGHFFGVALLLVNAARWVALPAAARAALAAAADDATAAQRRLAAAEDAACLERLGADGCAVLGPEALDRAGFLAAARPLRDAALAALDPALRAALPG